MSSCLFSWLEKEARNPQPCCGSATQPSLAPGNAEPVSRAPSQASCNGRAPCSAVCQSGPERKQSLCGQAAGRLHHPSIQCPPAGCCSPHPCPGPAERMSTVPGGKMRKRTLPTQGALCPTERPVMVSNLQPRGQASCKAASYWDSHTQGHREVASAPGVPPPCQTPLVRETSRGRYSFWG